MNILKTLRKTYISIFLAGLILFVSCTNNDKISDINSQALNEFKMTSINDSKLSNELNDLFGEKNARNNNVNYNFESLTEVENTETGEISYMVDSDENENIKLGVYPTEEGDYKFLEVEYLNNDNLKDIIYKDINGNEMLTVSINTETEEISFSYPENSSMARDCGEATAECLSDSYTNRGWTSVGLWVITGFFPAFGIGAAIGCAIAVC